MDEWAGLGGSSQIISIYRYKYNHSRHHGGGCKPVYTCTHIQVIPGQANVVTVQTGPIRKRQWEQFRIGDRNLHPLSAYTVTFDTRFTHTDMATLSFLTQLPLHFIHTWTIAVTEFTGKGYHWVSTLPSC